MGEGDLMPKYHLTGYGTTEYFTAANDDEAAEHAKSVARSHGGAGVNLFPGDGTRKPKWGWHFNYAGRLIRVIT